jgi:hypothetical protein
MNAGALLCLDKLRHYKNAHRATKERATIHHWMI